MVEIIDETQRYPSLKVLEEVIEAWLKTLGLKETISLILCDDAFIQDLNLRDQGLDKPTDVLSYPLWEADDAKMPMVEQLGDVFISIDTAKRQAKEHQHDLNSEVLVLAAHGITHLRGFDHPTEEAWQTFHEAQRQVIELYRARP